MPTKKDFKRRVRARMRKTGEAYTAARARLIEKRAEPAVDEAARQERVPDGAPQPERTAGAASRAERGAAATPAPDLAALAGMSDAATQAKTGKTWAQWVRALDALDATKLAHRDIARRLMDDFAVPGWWAQMVTVGYERIRGLRERNQHRGGGYEINKSLTLPVPIARLYRAFGARTRRKWLGPVPLTLRKATPERTMRLRWADDTPVVAYFLAKGPAKSQVTIQHGNLPTKARADELRAFWTERLGALRELLAPRR